MEPKISLEPRLEVIHGTMFCGKSTELIRRVNRLKVVVDEIQVFKPIIDDRYSKDHVASHDGLMLEAEYVKNSAEMFNLIRDNTKVIGVDEIQFFDEDIINVARHYVDNGGILIAAGLLKDFRDEYFPFQRIEKKEIKKRRMSSLLSLTAKSKKERRLLTMADLIKEADYTDQLYAICNHKNGANEICGNLASRVQRFTPDGEVVPYDSKIIVVGSKDQYAPRCRGCFQPYPEARRR